MDLLLSPSAMSVFVLSLHCSGMILKTCLGDDSFSPILLGYFFNKGRDNFLAGDFGSLSRGTFLLIYFQGCMFYSL
jgi:hypothetical protein